MLDGVYRRTGGEPEFQEARAPTGDELQGLLEKTIARLKEGAAGNVVLQLKSPWRDGTTHLRMTPRC